MSSTTFGALGVPTPIVRALAREGKTEAFPIQVDTLPETLAGRDVLGRGRTGSGKTLAFAIPLVVRLGANADQRRRPGRPRGLVLAPTRELATQINAVIAPLAKEYHLTTTTIFGGVNQRGQVNALRAGVDIVVACPGRLDDLMNQRHANLDAVEMTVLDEADHMADLGFLPVVTRIMTATPRDGQRMMFSATLDKGVQGLVRRFLRNEVMHSVDEVTTPVDAMTHHVLHVSSPSAKAELVRRLASGSARRILFTRTKHHAKKLARQLADGGIAAVDLHGNLSQPQRDRNLAAFSEGRARVLVATDVAARGVHVDDVELVIHVDPPVEHKAYLHRSGRTARAGQAGDVVTIALPAQHHELAQVLRRAAVTVTPVQVTAESAAVDALVGDVAPAVTPPPRREQTPRGGAASGPRNGRGAPGGRGARSGGRGGNGGGARSGSGPRSGSGARSGRAKAPAGTGNRPSRASGGAAGKASGGASRGASVAAFSAGSGRALRGRRR